MLATLEAALLVLPRSKLRLLVAEAIGGWVVGFCTLGLGLEFRLKSTIALKQK